jgi:hypothetical protein
MANLFYSDGSIVLQPVPANAECLFYDSHSNPTLYSEVYANPTAYSVVDGILTRDGAPVVINPPCDDCAALDALDSATTVAQLRKALLVMRDKPGFTRG